LTLPRSYKDISNTYTKISIHITFYVTRVDSIKSAKLGFKIYLHVTSATERINSKFKNLQER